MTTKEITFCKEYLLDLNQSQAAIRAGYSVKTSRSIANTMMKKEHIKENIEKELAKRSARTGINQDRVVRELARIAFVNAPNLINIDDADLKSGATEDDTAAIASVKVKRTVAGDVEREIKLVDKVKALELLGKHLGMYIDRIQISEVPQIIDDISKNGDDGDG